MSYTVLNKHSLHNHFIFITVLPGFCCYPHFTSGTTEAEKLSNWPKALLGHCSDSTVYTEVATQFATILYSVTPTCQGPCLWCSSHWTQKHSPDPSWASQTFSSSCLKLTLSYLESWLDFPARPTRGCPRGAPRHLTCIWELAVELFSIQGCPGSF